jgi:hypothetical protein
MPYVKNKSQNKKTQGFPETGVLVSCILSYFVIESILHKSGMLNT